MPSPIPPAPASSRPAKRRAAPPLRSITTLPGAGPCAAHSRLDQFTLREARLDRVAAGKSRLWHINLRLSELVNGLALCLPLPWMIHRQWSTFAAATSATFAVGGMWIFARWMRPREERLRRHMAFLACRRRPCAWCGYVLNGIDANRCPECGSTFDAADTRHILSPDAVQMYSHRARMISAVVIVGVLFWVSAIAQGADRVIHVALAGGLLFAFHIMHLVWCAQARRQEARHAADDNLPPLPACPGCAATIAVCWKPPPTACPECQRPLSPVDTFIRPDARRPTDPRILRLQYLSLMARWMFLIAVCGGLTVLVHLDQRLLYQLTFGAGKTALFFSLGIPVLAWVVLTTVLFRVAASRLYRRMRLLFAQVQP